MKPFDLVTNAARLAALEAQHILDTPPEQGFDDIVHLASEFCETPVALVSLVAEDRQWFKARVGFAPCETDLGSSVCRFVLGESDLLVIPDLMADERTAANPLVAAAPHIRFYAGAPLRDPEGHDLGSLCVIDNKPRPGGLTPRQADALRSLARQVMRQIELRGAVVERDLLLRERSLAEMRRYGLLTLGDHLRDVGDIDDLTFAAAAIVGQTLGVDRAGFALFEAGHDRVRITRDWSRDSFASLAGTHATACLGMDGAAAVHGVPVAIGDLDQHGSGGTLLLQQAGVRSLVNMPVGDRGQARAILFVHDHDLREWTPEALAFLRNAADRVGIGIARLQAERDQHLLNQELSHRMKNTLATVQAIAVQTLKKSVEPGVLEAFRQRIQALASAHAVLLQQSWAAAEIGTVVRGALESFSLPDRFRVEGSRIDLGPRATLSLSLLLHELTTNALKHGALSVDGGWVEIAWRTEAGSLFVTWRERGGPPACEPVRRGFGSRLIGLGLVGTGGADLRYPPGGFEADFSATIADAQQGSA